MTGAVMFCGIDVPTVIDQLKVGKYVSDIKGCCDGLVGGGGTAGQRVRRVFTGMRDMSAGCVKGLSRCVGAKGL